MKYIQNRTNWCWVAACKVAGEQYKKNFTEMAFTLENPETEVAVCAGRMDRDTYMEKGGTKDFADL